MTTPQVDHPDPEQTSSSHVPSPSLRWVLLLSIYMVLFVGTGWFAFVDDPISSATFADSTKFLFEPARDIVKAGYEAEIKAYEARQDLAFQSFNVVLGAVLGFLSASATRAFETPGAS